MSSLLRRPLSVEDRELDRLWRARFGQPLPIRGAPVEMVREILNTTTVNVTTMVTTSRLSMAMAS